jgi:hypothetical protein
MVTLPIGRGWFPVKQGSGAGKQGALEETGVDGSPCGQGNETQYHLQGNVYAPALKFFTSSIDKLFLSRYC